MKPVRSCSREGRTGGGSSRESFLFQDVLAERSRPIKAIKRSLVIIMINKVWRGERSLKKIICSKLLLKSNNNDEDVLAERSRPKKAIIKVISNHYYKEGMDRRSYVVNNY